MSRRAAAALLLAVAGCAVGPSYTVLPSPIRSYPSLMTIPTARTSAGTRAPEYQPRAMGIGHNAAPGEERPFGPPSRW